MSSSHTVTIDSVSFPGQPRRKLDAAALWWLSDTAGAVLFAGCLSLLLGDWAAQGRPPVIMPALLAGIVLSGILRAGTQGMAGLSGQRDAISTKRELRTRLIAALLPTGLVRGRLAGEDMRVAIDDVEAYEGLIARFNPLKFAAVASPLLIALIVAFASWVCAAIMLVTLVPFGVGMAFAGLAGKAEAEKQLQALSRMSGLFVDRVATLPVVLAFGAEDRVTRQIGEAAREVATRTMQVLRVAFLSSAVLEFFAALSVALVAVYCGFSLLGLLPFPAPESLTLGRAFFALALAPEFYLGMRRMAAGYHDKQQGEAAEASMAATLQQAEARRPAAPIASVTNMSCLSIDRLEVIYAEDNRVGPYSAAWQGPGLHALTGPTGTGKSSLLHALIGMAPAVQGIVSIDGNGVEPASLSQWVGWAGQRPLLLPGTLGENLTLASREGGADLLPLLEACGLASLIGERSLDLVIDPRGSGLSGGERRRIGLVRAIASGRPILLLDEPTADLDSATARQVIDLITEIARDRLVIAATHDAGLVERSASVVTLS
ncbi:ABC transporter ATP-binding protein/permease [Novosphingobium album (ex Hu et al. 2023)]|uniref:ATP-binding cassette domain-containing protein n=1 Tax=Novosphingobium album (ex Hu et al. 2023) TaxID=2930093 RepID=A0ABT0AY07_9SPHN|nr:ATP-binding cassette domain-containing protein [Novosphingobium album (ex Hu et al. 2023)]MCJ2177697.1 ATP-binding cassette domain-containing protein [Novosphingobium album (ex Hu et al. 2023)]